VPDRALNGPISGQVWTYLIFDLVQIRGPGRTSGSLWTLRSWWALDLWDNSRGQSDDSILMALYCVDWTLLNMC
jgi:hypothetical protein